MKEEEDESEGSSCLIHCQSPDTPMTDSSYSETGMGHTHIHTGETIILSNITIHSELCLWPPNKCKSRIHNFFLSLVWSSPTSVSVAVFWFLFLLEMENGVYEP